MSLHKNDFFEGIYQLKEELHTSYTQCRWRAVDYTFPSPKSVVIDFLPIPFDDPLHWIAPVSGLIRVQQSKPFNFRYFVWEEGKEQTVSQLSSEKIAGKDSKTFVDLLNTIPASLSANEQLLPLAPEFWQTGSGEPIVFFRKQPGRHTDPATNGRILEDWKNAIGESETASVSGEAPVQKAGTGKIPLRAVILAAIGIMLAFGAFMVKRMIDTRSVSPTRKVHAVKFDYEVFKKTIDEGVSMEQSGDYVHAVELFEVASKFPTSDITRKTLDSLGDSYFLLATTECNRYKQSQNAELYFIPNQYFHYASILKGTARKKCE
ncbi:hypothetical protein [Arundinibacter roseus]|uniref:Uncharacterized protein n=1 Tax=Arundinibacter roseus TaxID=2070510 RepID=A0A4R4KHC0_9BACT|nr:hypothetical protein [Arundinibacter roseus]TDB67484.1 hypothetical protein EZE20_05925 [Arundinibacter roseus]